ncbi:MAG: hypothetical protein IKX59_09040 [Bacteroidales bacterium]|nr:hypothetical protein [Bacteroidales bacterium]
MKTKITAIIERNPDGEYSIYTQEKLGKVGLHGYGPTPEDAIKDFWVAYDEMKELLNGDVPEIDVSFKYDVASFLREFKNILSLSGLQIVTGIHQKQLHHYLTGTSKPTKGSIEKIERGVHELAHKLSEIEFV